MRERRARRNEELTQADLTGKPHTPDIAYVLHKTSTNMILKVYGGESENARAYEFHTLSAELIVFGKEEYQENCSTSG